MFTQEIDASRWIQLGSLTAADADCNSTSEGAIIYRDSDDEFYGCRDKGSGYEWKKLS